MLPGYFVFADHSIWLTAFAIRLTPSGSDFHQVIATWTRQTEYPAPVIALSFSEFVEHYLAGETSRSCLSVGMPITMEQGHNQSEINAATRKKLVAAVDQTLPILTSFEREVIKRNHRLSGGDIDTRGDHHGEFGPTIEPRGGSRYEGCWA